MASNNDNKSATEALTQAVSRLSDILATAADGGGQRKYLDLDGLAEFLGNITGAATMDSVSASDNVLVEHAGSIRRVSTLALSAHDEESYSYGIQRDIADSDPDACVRVGNLNYHVTLPVHNGMRGCLLDDNGNVTSYLPTGSWEGSVRDGSAGQVMVEIPRHWRKTVVDENGIMQVRVSPYELAGYQEIPLMYVGAYEAAEQRSTNKLCSVMNEDADYRGAANNASYDGTGATFLGRPATYVSLTSFRTHARNRGTAGKNGCGWNAYLYEAHKALYWLFVIEYATLNSQKDFNAALTAEGYHQGGLGNGVTNINATLWTAFNGVYPFIPCGYTDEYGNGTGVKAYAMPDEYGASLTTYVPRYRGVENPFGHIAKWCDGILFEVNPDVADGGNGLTRVLTCKDPANFSSTITSNYSHEGNIDRTNSGYVKTVILGENGDINATDVSGSSSTYYCDNHSGNNSVTDITTRGLRVGNIANGGASAGFLYVTSVAEPSSPASSVGTRLCFLPA